MNILIFVIIAFAVVIVLYALFFRKQKLTPKQQYDFRNKLQVVMFEEDVTKKILGYEKVLEAVLKARGYKKSVGQILKKHPKLFINIDDMWFAHKLRNTVAHEIDCTISAKNADRASAIFEKEILALIGR